MISTLSEEILIPALLKSDSTVAIMLSLFASILASLFFSDSSISPMVATFLFPILIKKSLSSFHHFILLTSFDPKGIISELILNNLFGIL